MLENMPDGSIYIDDIDIATVPRSILRKSLTAIPQETLIIPGSMRENIDPLKLRNVDDIKLALEKVGLASLVADRGGIDISMADISLSQGELQLFAVARAILSPSKVLVVDEMTASMDHSSEKVILDLVKAEFEGSTILAVAHRLATIVDFDMVIVLDAGRLVESGRPHELLQRPDGQFKRMWDQQESQGRQVDWGSSRPSFKVCTACFANVISVRYLGKDREYWPLICGVPPKNTWKSKVLLHFPVASKSLPLIPKPSSTTPPRLDPQVLLRARS